MKYSLLAVLLSTLSANAYACGTSIVNGPTTINSPSVDCFSWQSGDLTIGTAGSIIPNPPTGSPISTVGDVGTLTNNGSIISNNDQGGGEPVRITNNVNAIINNSGALIQNRTSAFSIFVLDGTVSSISNSGTIQNLGNSVGDANAAIGVAFGSGVITNLDNLSGGVISTVGAPAILASYGGIITNINNAGLISTSGSSGDFFGIGDKGAGIFNDGIMNSITNTGTITSTTVGAFGVINRLGSINTLNNLQGGDGFSQAKTALTYTGVLPTNYNIIINSPSHYGQLSASFSTGSTTFGISALTGSNIGPAGTIYANVLTGLSAANIDNENTTLSYVDGSLSATYELVASNVANAWDLFIISVIGGSSGMPSGPTVFDTQRSLTNLAPKLRSIFSTQIVATNFANMNTYECNLFDTNGMCISAGGRYTNVDSPSSNVSSAVVVVGYKASQNIRIGGFLDQNFNNDNPTGVHISNKNPLMGLFAVWNLNSNGLGYQFKLANAYQEKDVSTTREVNGTSEAGRGNTNLNTQSYVGELSYAFLANNDKTLIRPYATLRYTKIKQDGYTEDASITAPLTYAAIEDRSTTALLGVKLNHKLAEKVNLIGSLGIEQDLEHHVDDLTATGVSSLTSENFNDSINRTRPVASIGMNFNPTNTQRISGEIYYQQLAFQSTGSTTAYVNYMIGF